MNKLTLLLPHGIMQASIEAETLEEALKVKPEWMYPLPGTPHLWIFRGDAQRPTASRTWANFGDSSLLQSSQFAGCLNDLERSVTSKLRELPAEIIAKYLNDKFAHIRQM